jgi:hypothetical protein
MTLVLMNPGTGPVGGQSTARDARRNIGAFCRELGLGNPRVRIERSPSGDDGKGRYDFIIHRGIRSVSVEMPGLSLDRVALRAGDNAWNFPRLYVDGSSWLWPYALNCAREALRDHDGSAERGYQKSAADCDFVFANEPRCTTCGTIKERYLTQERENPPYGYERLRCLTCTPVATTGIWSTDNALYMDDSWKRLEYGCVYRVTTRRMPYAALGGDEDPICTIGYYSNKQCRLRRGHSGMCEPLIKETARERIDLPYQGDQ